MTNKSKKQKPLQEYSKSALASPRSSDCEQYLMATSNSIVRQKDVNRLADEVNARWSSENRDRFLGKNSK